MRKFKSKCPRCSGTGFMPDKLWGKVRCDKYGCKKGVIITIVKTDEEIDREARQRLESGIDDGKL